MSTKWRLAGTILAITLAANLWAQTGQPAGGPTAPGATPGAGATTEPGGGSVTPAGSENPGNPGAGPAVQFTDLAIKGKIEGANITFTLTFLAEVMRSNQEIPLTAGDVVLMSLNDSGGDVGPDGTGRAEPRPVAPLSSGKVRYDREKGEYYLSWEKKGTYPVTAVFAVRAAAVEGGDWRESTFTVPAAPVRQLELECDRTDLEVLFPGAMRVDRKVDGGKLTITAVQGPGRPMTVRWKPQVQELDAKLVAASEANTVVSVGGGALRLDMVVLVDIAQGKLSELTFRVPSGLSVTQVRGLFIQDWKLTSASAGDAEPGATTRPAAPGVAPAPGVVPGVGGDAAGGEKLLHVVLNRPQVRQYALQIVAEAALPKFPAEVDLPVIQPLGGIRATGQVCVGTDSAIQLVMKQTGGLAQVEGAAFPRMALDREHPRALPAGKAFFYTYPATPYQLRMTLDDIVPSYDASDRLVIGVREEDLVIEGEIELDVRDAPLRAVRLLLPAGFTVAGLGGANVGDYSVVAGAAANPGAGGAKAGIEVDVHFRQPQLGRTLIALRLELGKSPLDQARTIEGLAVEGAKSERGYLVVAAENGIQFESAKPRDPQVLRQVNTASTPLRVNNAQYAFRFRTPGWSLDLLARKKPAGIRAELFQLISLGDGVAFGSVAVSYYIDGSPVDELTFYVPEQMESVEFVGKDVRRWDRDPAKPGLFKVKLQRKVIGDYNLGVTFQQKYKGGVTSGGATAGAIGIGGVECRNEGAQSGYVVVASALDLQAATLGKPDAGLLEIEPEDVPEDYRLLVNAPVLKAYKYATVQQPHAAVLQVSTYRRGSLLPMVVEMTDIRTQIGVRDNAPADALTTVRYRVKNVSEQFLALTMPSGASKENWRAYLEDLGGTGRVHVAASYDVAKNQLLIPLPRKPNPNEPVTIVLEYGQDQPAGGRMVTLTAPVSGARSTFDTWTLGVPDGWAISAAPGTSMIAEPRPTRRGDVAGTLESLASCWGRALIDRQSHGPQAGPEGVTWVAVGLWYTLFALMIAAGVLILTFFFRRRALPDVLVLMLSAALLWLGINAAQAPAFNDSFGQTDNWTQLRFTQAVNVDTQAPLTIHATLTPAWRQYAATGSALWLPLILAGAALVLAVIVRLLRPALLAIVLAALAYWAAQFPPGDRVLGHVFTWGLPTLLAAWFVWRQGIYRLLKWRPSPQVVAAAGLVLMAGLFNIGCTAPAPIDDRPPLVERPVLERVETLIQAEKDSLAVDMTLQIDAEAPMRFTILDPAVVLLTPARISEVLRVTNEDGDYYLQVRQKGRHEVHLRFLEPLPDADENQRRGFRLPVPLALTNRVHLSVPQLDLDVAAPTALRLTRAEKDKATEIDSVFAPGEDAAFVWRPRARQTNLEKTSFYAEATTLVRCDAGVVECRNLLRFQIAQGELKEIHLLVPPGMTVTAVDGAALGTWRFDPAKREVEARLMKPVTGEYRMAVVTQIAPPPLPYTASVGQLTVLGAERQRGTLGLVTSAAVYAAVQDGPQSMNVDDFAREAAGLLGSVPEGAAGLRFACRVTQPGDAIKVQVSEVKPEIRVVENSVFTVADDRLLYNAELAVDIAKAGVFSVDLRLPRTYDIDALGAPEVSHWDDNAEGDTRTVQVHFRNKVQGRVTLKLTLSRPLAEVPPQLPVPRVQVAGALKHLGQVVVSSDRSVRLTVDKRDGVSEFDAAELGPNPQGALAFRLLRPDWALDLKTEVPEPRINVDFLHVAQVHEGGVRHTDYLMYRMFNAGVKVFELRVPAGATGVQISGSEIAHKDPVAGSPGRWRVELAAKKYDGPYHLKLRYDTPPDRAPGTVDVASTVAVGADLQRGTVAVLGNDRLELQPANVDPALQAAEPRTIPAAFRAGDLSDAVLCYVTVEPNYHLTLSARRHEAAGLLSADVRKVIIRTVATESGQTINRVQLALHVGSKRHLEALLPVGARVWSLSVNGRAVVPSLDAGPGGQDRVLIPVAQAAADELETIVDLVYLAPGPSKWGAAARITLEGPRFDLPLKDVNWLIYVPENHEYSHIGGTMMVDERLVTQPEIERYNARAYAAQVRQANKDQLDNARILLNVGKKLADEGRNAAARQALESAGNYSYADPSINEDSRGNLRQLNQTQALVGLVQNRGNLRPDAGETFVGRIRRPSEVRNSLSKEDNDNLEQITKQLSEAQEAAAGANVQLLINLPTGGRVLQFGRDHLVDRNAEIAVTMDIRPIAPARSSRGLYWAGGLLAGLAILFGIGAALGRRWSRVRDTFTPSPTPAAAAVGEGGTGTGAGATLGAGSTNAAPPASGPPPVNP